MSILTAAEVAAIRERVNRRDPSVGGGYTWTAIESLCDTVDALRAQLVSARAITPMTDVPP